MNKVNMTVHNGDFIVESYMVSNGRFNIKIPDNITGAFICIGLSLSTLEGGPKEVHGYYDCSRNRLENLKGSPIKIYDGFNCSRNILTSLIGCPNEIHGPFDCSNNLLISLKEGPSIIRGQYDCSYNNNLIYFDSNNVEIYGDFNFYSIRLKSLVNFPKVRKNIYSDLANPEVAFILSNKNIDTRPEFYWLALLNYMINEKSDLSKINWPKRFLTKNLTKSAKIMSKFDL